jgi:tetratricopeptide (TPR) repeat protein
VASLAGAQTPATTDAAAVQESARLLKDGKAAEALRALKAAPHPDAPEVLMQTGTVQLALKNLTDAEDAFRALWQAEPGNTRGAAGMTEALYLRDGAEAALRFVFDEAAKKPQRADLRVLAADTAVRAGHPELANPEYERLLTQLPSTSPALPVLHAHLGEAYRRQGNAAQAIPHFQKALELAPGNKTNLMSLAVTFDTAGMVNEAREAYEAILKMDPDNAPVLNNLAYLLAQTGGDLEHALDLAQHARRLLPAMAEVWDTTGWIYLKAKMSAPAVSMFQDLVKRHPESAEYHYHLGLALEQSGEHAAAAAAMKEALAHNPSKELVEKILPLIPASR